MNVSQIITAIREDYLEQLTAFIAEEQRRDPAARAGVRVDAPDSGLFARAYVPDVAFGDPVERMSDLVPRERNGSLGPFNLVTPDLSVTFEDLWWNDVRLDHNGAFTAATVSAWFQRWFPVAVPSPLRSDDLKGFIHSATVDEKWITVDFGSAEPKALFELLSATKRCGASDIVVTATRQPA